jgi:alpha-amylase
VTPSTFNPPSVPPSRRGLACEDRARVLLLPALLALAFTLSSPAAPAPGSAGFQPASEPSAPATTPWWQSATFYQIFVRSYADASTGPLAGDGIGDFQGLIERLDHLNDGDPATTTDLGVSGIWLLPIGPSPSYHGYDVTDYYGVHPDYGDLALFRRFLAEARKRGIRVVIDLVLNHASSQHPAFLAATADEPPASITLASPPSAAPVTAAPRDLFRFSPRPLQSQGPWGDRAWHYKDGEYYYGVFDSAMPDWNFRHDDVTAHHRDVARFWLQDVGVDGFRLDAIRYLYEQGDSLQDLAETKRWLRQFAAHCRELKPDVFLVGEVWADTDQAASYVNAGSVDTTFDFDLANSLLETAAFGTPNLLAARLARTRTAYGSKPWATFLANHDQPRAMTRLGGDFAKARLAASLQFTAPGTPFIYYGEELGQQGAKPDPDIRRPYQWSAAPHAGFSTVTPWRTPFDNYSTVNLAAQLADPASLYHHYARLVRLRARSEALRSGSPVSDFNYKGRGIYADLRASAADTVLVLANTATRPREATLALPPAVAALGAPTLLHADVPGEPPDFAPTLTIPGQTVLVFRWPAPPAPDR